MSSWPETVRDIVSDGLPVEESPSVLKGETWLLLRLIKRDPQWHEISRTVGRIVAEQSRHGVRDYNLDGMALIEQTLFFQSRIYTGQLERNAREKLEAKLTEAEADIREHLPEIAEKLPQVEKAADEIATNPQKSEALKRIVRVVKKSRADRLSPFALLVIFWGLFIVGFPKDTANEVAVLALWYAIARDMWKKGD
jgi:hypothetical protein